MDRDSKLIMEAAARRTHMESFREVLKWVRANKMRKAVGSNNFFKFGGRDVDPNNVTGIPSKFFVDGECKQYMIACGVFDTFTGSITNYWIPNASELKPEPIDKPFTVRVYVADLLGSRGVTGNYLATSLYHETTENFLAEWADRAMVVFDDAVNTWRAGKDAEPDVDLMESKKDNLSWMPPEKRAEVEEHNENVREMLISWFFDNDIDMVESEKSQNTWEIRGGPPLEYHRDLPQGLLTVSLNRGWVPNKTYSPNKSTGIDTTIWKEYIHANIYQYKYPTNSTSKQPALDLLSQHPYVNVTYAKLDGVWNEWQKVLKTMYETAATRDAEPEIEF